MKKYRLFILLCLAGLLTACSIPLSPVQAYYVEYQEEKYSYRDMEIIKDKIAIFEERMDAAHNIAESARKLDYLEDSSVILLAKKEYEENRTERNSLRAIYNDIESHWLKKEKEYPTAAYIWKTLSIEGYNDEVIAGIIGNMMAEIGGHTLSLDWNLVDSGYYGLCQWNRGYSKVWWKDTEYQVKFLLDTIKYEFNSYGNLYKKNYDYEDFLLEKSPENAALAFAKAYERCGSGSYKQRQANATIAYNYFIS